MRKIMVSIDDEGYTKDDSNAYLDRVINELRKEYKNCSDIWFDEWKKSDELELTIPERVKSYDRLAMVVSDIDISKYNQKEYREIVQSVVNELNLEWEGFLGNPFVGIHWD